MDLGSVRFKGITEEEFAPLFNFWFDYRRENRGIAKAKIETPLQFQDYEALFRAVSFEKEIRRLSYFHRRWIKREVRELTSEDIGKIIGIVEENPHRNGGLELYFSQKSANPRSNPIGTRIRMVGVDGVVVGYDMFVPNHQVGLFTWDERPRTEMAYGLWKPE